MQTIYLRDDETAFAGRCELCLMTQPTLYAPAGDTRVLGTLGRSVDLGFRTCRRGHRILIKRVRVMEPV